MEPPAEMLMSLLPFQKEFLAWAVSQERGEIKGGILADEMGMGKTIQVQERQKTWMLEALCADTSSDLSWCNLRFGLDGSLCASAPLNMDCTLYTIYIDLIIYFINNTYK